MSALPDRTDFRRAVAGRFAPAPTAFALLAARAGARRLVTYAEFADELGLGSPRNLGWLLSPLVGWCDAKALPPLPIIVVRRADGLPSGGYAPDRIAAETERVFAQDWSAVPPPAPADLHPFCLPRLPTGLRAPSFPDLARC